MLGVSVLWAQEPEKRNLTRVSELTELAAGLYLPVVVGKTLRSGRARVGSALVVKTTQRVFVSENGYLDRDVKVSGEVIGATAGDGTAAHPAFLSIRFSSVSYHSKTVPVVTRAVAVANLIAVGDTSLPMQAADRGNSNPASWTTRQVGGDLVCRSGWVGDVVDTATRTVGFADYYGVYSLPVTMGGRQILRSMGVFSTSAKGLYGYEHGATLESGGGTITITSPEKQVVLRNGDDLLLEVVQR
jgi:hypothetical protein